MIKKAEKPLREFESAECGMRNQIRNPKLAIRDVVSGPDAENERSDESDRKSASDDSRVAMQSTREESRGFSCCE